MTDRIDKHGVPFSLSTDIDLPEGAAILACVVDFDKPFVWVRRRVSLPASSTLRLTWFETGEEIPDWYHYVATVIDNGRERHLHWRPVR